MPGFGGAAGGPEQTGIPVALRQPGDPFGQSACVGMAGRPRCLGVWLPGFKKSAGSRPVQLPACRLDYVPGLMLDQPVGSAGDN